MIKLLEDTIPGKMVKKKNCHNYLEKSDIDELQSTEKEYISI